MSSAGAHCDHINHVTTQIPYALTVAAVCIPGYIIAGIIGFITNTGAAVIATPVMLILLFIVLGILRKRSVQAE